MNFNEARGGDRRGGLRKNFQEAVFCIGICFVIQNSIDVESPDRTENLFLALRKLNFLDIVILSSNILIRPVFEFQ